MSKEYQARKTEYRLPHNMYMQIVYLIRDYDRMRREYGDIILSSPAPGGQPRGNQHSDTTAAKNIRLEAVGEKIDAIDRAIHDTAAEYSNKIKRPDITAFEPVDSFFDLGVFCYTLYEPRKHKQPSRRSWNYFKSKFAYRIAANLKLI